MSGQWSSERTMEYLLGGKRLCNEEVPGALKLDNKDTIPLREYPEEMKYLNIYENADTDLVSSGIRTGELHFPKKDHKGELKPRVMMMAEKAESALATVSTYLVEILLRNKTQLMAGHLIGQRTTTILLPTTKTPVVEDTKEATKLLQDMDVAGRIMQPLLLRQLGIAIYTQGPTNNPAFDPDTVFKN